MPRAIPKYTHWTDDTETAFIMALRFHGHVVKAIEEIGRSVDSAYKKRRSKPAFAARWKAALAEHEEKRAVERKLAKRERDGGDEDAGVMPNRARFDGWTVLRQRAFFRALTRSGDVKNACTMAGISDESAYRMRRLYPSFAAAWDRALAKSEPTLEQIAVDRAVNGVKEPVWHGGKVVGHKTKYSDTLMRDALKREDERSGLHKTKKELIADAFHAAKIAGGDFSPNGSADKAVGSILKKLDAIERHRRRQEAEEAVRLLAEGLVP